MLCPIGPSSLLLQLACLPRVGPLQNWLEEGNRNHRTSVPLALQTHHALEGMSPVAFHHSSTTQSFLEPGSWHIHNVVLKSSEYPFVKNIHSSRIIMAACCYSGVADSDIPLDYAAIMIDDCNIKSHSGRGLSLIAPT